MLLAYSQYSCSFPDKADCWSAYTFWSSRASPCTNRRPTTSSHSCRYSSDIPSPRGHGLLCSRPVPRCTGRRKSGNRSDSRRRGHTRRSRRSCISTSICRRSWLPSTRCVWPKLRNSCSNHGYRSEKGFHVAGVIGCVVPESTSVLRMRLLPVTVHFVDYLDHVLRFRALCQARCSSQAESQGQQCKIIFFIMSVCL